MKKEKNKNYLKTLLTTASAVAVLTTGAGNAQGVATRTPNVGANNTAHTGTALEWDAGPGAGNALKFGDDNQTIEINTLGGLVLNEVLLNGKATPKMNINVDASLGSISGAGADLLKITVDNTGGAKALTFTGVKNTIVTEDTYDGVGSIDMGGNGTLVINSATPAAITLASTFSNAANATLTLTTDLKATDASVAGFGTITIANTKAFTIAPLVSVATAAVGAPNLAAAIMNNVQVDLFGAAGAGTITFGGNDGKLNLESEGGASNVFVLNKHFASGGGGVGKGIVTLKATGDDGNVAAPAYSKLVLKVANPANAKDFGDDGAATGNKFKELNLIGDANSTLTIEKGVVIKTAKLTTSTAALVPGTTFTIKDKSVAALTAVAGIVTIGDNTNLVIEGGAYANNDPVNAIKIENTAGDIVLGGADATLTLSNANADAATKNDNVIFQLENNFNPTAAGIVVLSNTTTGKGKLRLISSAGGGRTLGETNALKHLEATGTKPIVIDNAVALNLTDGILIKKGADLTVGFSAAATKATIGEADPGGGGAKYTIDLVGKGGVAVNYNPHPLNKVVLAHVDSTLGFTNSSGAANETVNFQTTSLDPGDPAGKGILEFSSSNTKTLSLTATGGAITLGTNGNNLKEVRIIGGTVEAAAANLAIHTKKLSINDGSFQTKDANIVKSAIAIGVAAGLNPLTHPAVDGTLIVNTAGDIADFGLAGVGSAIKLNTADSVLQMKLSGAPGAAKSYTLQNNIEPEDDTEGQVVIDNTSDGAFTVKGNAAETIGLAAKRLKKLTASGNKESIIKNDIYAKEVIVSSTSEVKFEGAVTTFKPDDSDKGFVHVTGASPSIVFGEKTHKLGRLYLGNAANVVKLSDNAATIITGDIINKAGAANRGKVEFLGDGKIDGTVGVGENGALLEVKFNGGAAEITGNAAATRFVVADNAAVVKLGGDVTGNALFDDKDGQIIFSGETFTGNIDTATSDMKGTFIINGEAEEINVTGTIGATKVLKELNFETDKQITLEQGVAGVRDIKYSSNAHVVSEGDITVDAGKLDFGGKNGLLVFKDRKNFTGDIDSTASAGGKVGFEKNGKITGVIGATNALKELYAGGAGTVELAGNEAKKITEIGLHKDATLELSGNGAHTIGSILPYDVIDVATQTLAAEGATVELGAGKEFLGASEFGKTTNKLKKIVTTAGQVYTFNNNSMVASEILGTGSFVYRGAANVLNVLDVEVKSGTLAKISLEAGATLEAKKNVSLTGELDLAGGSVFKAGSGVTSISAGGGIGQTTPGGLLELSNNSPLKMSGDIGKTGGKFEKITLKGQDVELATNNLHVTTLAFETNASIELKTSGDLGGANVTNSSSSNQHVISVSGDQNLTGNFGSSANPFGEIKLRDTNKTITVDTASFYGGLVSESGGGKVVVKKANAGLTKIGSDGKRFSNIKFDEGASSTVSSDVHGNKVEIAKNTTIVFGGLLDTSELSLLDEGSSATLGAGKDLNFLVTAGVNEKGTLKLGAGSSVRKDLANSSKRLALMDATAGAANFFNSKMFAKNHKFGAHSYKLENNLEIDGGVEAAGSTFDLGAKNLTLSNGNVTLTGDVKINTAVASENSLGQIKVNAGSGNKLNLSGTEKVTVNITATDRARDAVYDFITVSSGEVEGANKLVIGNENSTTSPETWEILARDGNKIKIQRKDQSEAALNEILSDNEFVSSDFAKNLSEGAPGSDVEKFEIELENANRILGTEAPNFINEVSERFNTTLDTSEIVSDVVGSTQSAILNRLDITPSVVLSFGPVSSGPISVGPVSVAPSSRVPSAPVVAAGAGAASIGGSGGSSSGASKGGSSGASKGGSSGGSGGASKGGSSGGSSESKDTQLQQKETQAREEKVSYDDQVLTGVAAGDANSYGVWGSPFYSQATQKTDKKSTGYKSSTAGGSIGFDVMASDEAIIGAAFTFANTEVKYKAPKAGDKTKIDTVMGTLYGVYQITSEYYLQGTMSFANSSIKNSEAKPVVDSRGNITRPMAKSKYSSMTIGGELTAGYNYVADNRFVLTPSAGIAVSRVNDESYKETGETAQNRQINIKASNKLELLAGFKASMIPVVYNDVSIAPELHANVRHDVRGKGPKVEIVKDKGAAGKSNVFSSRSKNLNKTTYSAGAGLSATYSNMEYGISYDAQFAKKYLGHQGSLKIKVNF